MTKKDFVECLKENSTINISGAGELKEDPSVEAQFLDSDGNLICGELIETDSISSNASLPTGVSTSNIITVSLDGTKRIVKCKNFIEYVE